MNSPHCFISSNEEILIVVIFTDLNSITLNRIEKTFMKLGSEKKTNEKLNHIIKNDDHLPWTLFIFFIMRFIQDTASVNNTCQELM